MNLFDELFNDFINKPNGNKKNNFVSDLKNLMNSLGDYHAMSPDEGEEFQKNLGKPDEIQRYTEGNMHFARLIWNTPTGKFIKVVFTNDPDYVIFPSYDEEPKSLQEQLEEAVEAENFELACVLRDKINLKNKKAKL
jgi:hypothetical protein